MRRPVATAAAVVVAVVLAAAVAGCSAELPESGPVVDAGARSLDDEQQAAGINAVPPADGLTASQVVLGFVDALSASPARYDVAEQFLTGAAAATWEPDEGMIVYGDLDRPREDGLDVTLPLVDAERLDRSGAYVGRLPVRAQTLRFEVTIEDGEYRITNPPDALVVRRDWFDQRYRQVSLYFFDPTGRVLVPEPVYVPRGGQLASNLVVRLLRGPSPSLAGVVRSFLPRGLDAGLSVPVSIDGVAEVDLGGTPEVAGAAGERLLAQLAWTLRQEPSVRAVRVTLGGEPLRGPDGETVYPVTAASDLSTVGPGSSTDLYAVRNGVLGTRVDRLLVPVSGPFGGAVRLRDAAVSLDGRRAAGISRDGRRLVLADLAAPVPGSGPPAPVAVRGAVDLLRPSWDFADRVWVVDRAGGAAVVRVVVDGRAQVVRVADVSGRDVVDFMVSRDGTRVVAVVEAEGSDEVRVGRVQLDDRGRVAGRVIETQVVDAEPDLARQVDDVAWISPTTIAELVPLAEDEIYEVRTIGVDGSPDASVVQPTPVDQPVRALVGTPVEGLPLYVLTTRGVVDLSDDSEFDFVGPRPSSVFYAG